MAKLTTSERKSLPSSEFAIPEERAYPTDTENRARNALNRVSQYGSSEEQARVRAKVHREYPEIKQSIGRYKSRDQK